MKKPRRALTPEEREARRREQQDHTALVERVAVVLGRPTGQVRQMWQQLKPILIGLVPPEPDGACVQHAKMMFESQFPAMDVREATQLMLWVIRKVKSAEVCRDALEEALEQEGLA